MRRILLLLLLFPACGPILAPSTPPVNRITFQGTCDQASPPEVISAFGQPTRTYVEGPFTYYEYAGRTFDPATRKTDALATITFRDGMAIEFHFSGAKRP